jgi:hypothetical protein
MGLRSDRGVGRKLLAMEVCGWLAVLKFRWKWLKWNFVSGGARGILRYFYFQWILLLLLLRTRASQPPSLTQGLGCAPPEMMGACTPAYSTTQQRGGAWSMSAERAGEGKGR